jgi:hypothetical protein
MSGAAAAWPACRPLAAASQQGHANVIAWLRAWWAAWVYRNVRTVCIPHYGGGEEWLTQEEADTQVVVGYLRRKE